MEHAAAHDESLLIRKWWLGMIYSGTAQRMKQKHPKINEWNVEESGGGDEEKRNWRI